MHIKINLQAFFILCPISIVSNGFVTFSAFLIKGKIDSKAGTSGLDNVKSFNMP